MRPILKPNWYQLDRLHRFPVNSTDITSFTTILHNQDQEQGRIETAGEMEKLGNILSTRCAATTFSGDTLSKWTKLKITLSPSYIIHFMLIFCNLKYALIFFLIVT